MNLMDVQKLDHGERVVRVVCKEDQKIVPFRNQSYEAIKRECLRAGRLFEDPTFPASDASMFYSQPVPTGTKWKRPYEICARPRFIVNEALTGDLDQGFLGDCWFIAACTAIVQVPELFTNVVPVDNKTLYGPDYAGIFHFRFWYYGQWVDVVVDDRLPVYASSNKLVFCHNVEQQDEFWAALLEKAYAKLCGSYENLDGGSTTDALIDMTGGIQETFEIKEMRSTAQREEIWQIMIRSRQHKSLIASSIAPNPRIREARQPNGLVMGHAYTITKIACIEIGSREVKLVRCRNPWGNEVEWRGPWSDNSYEWYSVSDDVKQALEYKRLGDGEFWMSFDDFYRNFESVQFCELTPDAFSVELLAQQNSKTAAKLTWKMTAYNGQWIPGKNSGGCGRENEMTYWTNPQFLITLTDYDPQDNENMATVVIALMQKYTREKRTLNRGESCEEYIQFRLYRVLNERDALQAKQTGGSLYANQLERCGTSGPYINMREVTKRFRLQPGHYLIIPSCYDENISGEFLLRVYTENPISDCDCCVLHSGVNDPLGRGQHSVENCSHHNTDTFFSTPKSDSEFSNWAQLINGSDLTASTLTGNLNNKSVNTLTHHDQPMNRMSTFSPGNNYYLKPKTSSPVYESKLYLHHTKKSEYERVNAREVNNRLKQRLLPAKHRLGSVSINHHPISSSSSSNTLSSSHQQPNTITTHRTVITSTNIITTGTNFIQHNRDFEFAFV